MIDARVLGTAGHVDHGKTALVRALTGHDTDRLAEERRRGISIELGFAPFAVGQRGISLIDVPGHERFVRHMVAGASGIDGYLLCVAADDGVMPQTREHMDVLRLLGVDAGVVAVTKIDRADPGRAADEARALVGGDAAIVPVSAVTGEGIADLQVALGRLVAHLDRRTEAGPSRLHVDRCFTVTGTGTVVTGTLWGDALSVGGRVLVHPSGCAGRIRGMHVHDRSVTSASGGRVALNLAGVERTDVSRGDVVTSADDDWHPTDRLDVEMTVLESAPAPVTTRRRLQAFLGTTETPATCVLLESDAIPPGASGLVQLRLERPVLARAGDRVVLRSADPRTVAGAVVIDPRPVRHGRGARVGDRLRALRAGDGRMLARMALRDAGPAGIPADSLEAGGLDAEDAVLIGGRWFAPAVVDAARGMIIGAGTNADEDAVARSSGLPRDAVRELLRTAGVRGLASETSAQDERIRTAIGDGGRRPPPPAVIGEGLGLSEADVTEGLRRLAHDGRVIRAGELWFDAEVLRRAVADAHAALVAEGALGIGELRDLWGVGRRQAIALAAHLDAIGMTRRVDDRRLLRPSFRLSTGS